MASDTCRSCGDDSVIITDPDTGAIVCTSCGAEVGPSVNAFVNHIPLTATGTLDFTAFSLTSADFTYRDRKLRAATAFLKSVASRLGISPLRSDEALQLALGATEGALALEGTIFLQDLSAACVYIVARRHNLPLSIAEVASSVGSDPHDLSELVRKISGILKLPPLPSFDTGASLERFVRNSQLLQNSEKSEEIIGQGRFLLHCCTKWSLSTGRHPLPLVASNFTLVAQVNGYGNLKIDDVANEMGVVVSTSRIRYRELVETLVRVSRVLLPWGKDVSSANLLHNASLLIRLMELKSKSSSFDRFLEGFKLDISDNLIGGGGGEEEKYYRNEKNGDDVEMERVKISGEQLLSVNRNVLERNRIECLKKNVGKSKRWIGDGLGFEEDYSSVLNLDKKRWKGMKNMDKAKILNIDVGYDAPPPSFVKGIEVRKLRRERIRDAKCRIEKVKMGCGDCEEEVSLVETKKKRKRRIKGVKGDCMDWEDSVIELLLLHGVNEREIEEGHYRRLMDLHVFGFT